MTGFRRAVLPLCVVLALLADASTAQTSAPARPIRQYNSLIQMHAAPAAVQVPDDAFETQKRVPESMDRDLVMPFDMQEESQIPPNGPRRKTKQEKQQKQNKNWILPSSTEPEDKDEEMGPTQGEEPAPSGWGWLADDVHARQQKEKEKDDQENSDSEDSKKKDGEFQPPFALRKEKEDGKSKTGGILLDTSFQRVSSSTSTKETEKDKTDDTSAQDESREQERNRADGPTTAESSRGPTSADQPRERRFGTEAKWGNESLWNKDSKSAGALPQTEALLSMSKLDAKKLVPPLERPGLKPDEEGGAAGQFEADLPEPAPRNLVAAPSFQPLPAVPVNDFGTASWDKGLPGNTPFGASTPFFSQPSVAPASAFEPLKAPELPKPIDSPWLK